ncbi:MAG TPA: hypothetical protein VIG31_01605 [Rhodanobacteraceae bacterium]
MIAHAASLDPILTLRFTRRKESWVAASSGRFYKITRKSDDPLRDLVDPACIGTSLREYTNVCFLHGLDKAVCHPESIDRACIVYPLLSGPDLRTLLISRVSAEQREASLQSAMRLLARLHHGDTADHPVKDYRHDGFLAPPPAVLERMAGRRRTLVVTGFEARNFRFDRSRNAWFFFDPHHVWSGHPEEDFARFVISLLMIRGRRRGLRLWTEFDRFRLRESYESIAPAKLDSTLLNYFLCEELAMRRFHATKLARRMPAAARVFVMAYTRLYYHQLQRALAAQRF